MCRIHPFVTEVHSLASGVDETEGVKELHRVQPPVVTLRLIGVGASVESEGVVLLPRPGAKNGCLVLGSVDDSSLCTERDSEPRHGFPRNLFPHACVEP